MEVDVSGEVIGTLDADGPFEGAIELSERLSDSLELQRCVAEVLCRQMADASKRILPDYHQRGPRKMRRLNRVFFRHVRTPCVF